MKAACHRGARSSLSTSSVATADGTFRCDQLETAPIEIDQAAARARAEARRAGALEVTSVRSFQVRVASPVTLAKRLAPP
jgi:hypothetical protein